MGIKHTLSGLIFFILVNINCFENQKIKNGSSQGVKNIGNMCQDSTITIYQGIKTKSIKWQRNINLPTSGRFSEESHYVTNQDKFINFDFPKNSTDSIAEHLERSYLIYKRYDPLAKFNALYKNSWNKVWTPSEGGEFGEGSIGNKQLKLLNPETELWLMTMMWSNNSMPKTGEKFIVSANNRSVVVVAGYETGPLSEDFIGGLTCEVHSWLKTNNKSIIKISYPKNQNIPIGPITCSNQ
jgi:hypothetical protein